MYFVRYAATRILGARRCHHLQGGRLSSRWRQRVYPTQWHVLPFITASHRRTKHSSIFLTLAISLALGWAENPLLSTKPTLTDWNRRKPRDDEGTCNVDSSIFFLYEAPFFRLLLFILKPCCDSWIPDTCQYVLKLGEKKFDGCLRPSSRLQWTPLYSLQQSFLLWIHLRLSQRYRKSFGRRLYVHKHYISRNMARLNIYNVCDWHFRHLKKSRQSLDSVIGRVGSNLDREKICISTAKFSDQFWGLLSPQFDEYLWGVKWPWHDDAHLHLAPRLRISGTISLLPNTPTCAGQIQLCQKIQV